ncbi:MAG: VWA domain-containing protein, partial [Chitinophagales bacterium]|nr:VWA domain-containing protein [Chitinophagales bacterium]
MNFIKQISFADKWVLATIPFLWLLCVLWFWYFRKKQFPAFTLSNTFSLASQPVPISAKFKQFLPFLRAAALTFLLIALARPQSSVSEEKISTEGIDIVIALDISTSMLAQDFKPNRLEAAKNEAINFVDARKSDRIGLVVFAGESFTQCPVTIDHSIVKNQLKAIKNGVLEDGTAIGMGLATAVQRLRESKAKSKVVILMTDGVNNRGLIDPLTATDIAIQFGVKVYTIGVGTNGKAYTPVAQDASGKLIFDYADVQIDEKLMREISLKTGGKYFRASNNQKLKEIYE